MMDVTDNLTETPPSPNSDLDISYDLNDLHAFMTHEYAFSSFYEAFLKHNDSDNLYCQLEDVVDENNYPSVALVFTRYLPTQDGLPQRRAKYEVRVHGIWGLVLLIYLPDHPANEASDPETVFRCLVPKDSEPVLRNAGFAGESALTFTVCLSPFFPMVFSLNQSIQLCFVRPALGSLYTYFEV